MWLNRLFYEEPIDFEKRCRRRIAFGIALAIVGVFAVMLAVPVSGRLAGIDAFIPDVYRWTGIGLAAGGAATAVRNWRYLRNEDLKKTRAVEETDERNRLLGLRCWAYAGYTMFLFLYVGMLVSGFYSAVVMKVLMAVAAGFALLLLVFRALLQRCM